VKAPVIDFGLDLEIRFHALPHWRGVTERPVEIRTLPFALGWDPRGFVRQSSPVAVRNEIVAGYADDRYHHITSPPGASRWANALGSAAIDFVDRTAKLGPGARVLEVGAGSVYTAKALVASGAVAEYVIVDPGIHEDSTDSRISVRRTYFDADPTPRRYFDLVIAINCFEHIEDPVKFLDDARRVLRDNGRIILVFPDITQQFLRGDLNVILHEHLNYFSFETAAALFERQGFRIVARETRADRQYFTLEPATEPGALGAIPVDRALTQVPQTFWRSLERSTSLLRESLATGQPVGLHGATNGLNNTLVLGGLARVPGLILFDGDESKTGHYLPAVAAPIRHASDPSYKQMARVYVAAITFFEEIRRDLVVRGLDRRLIEPLIPLESQARTDCGIIEDRSIGAIGG
jgi:SAM-dependent methyltransferase